ncbi:MAG: efflux RND transporter periplasmic adaptor subunit [Gemmataceae bacterium]|nr:efflux RND transporter periplasmic adaptor subunit [Gemmataceae bacterium]
MLRRFLCLLILWAALAGCARRPHPEPPPTPEVTVSVALERSVTNYEDFIGRLDAIKYVDIKSRVTGYLTKVYFKDGALVAKDEPLYEIDPRPFQAELDKAKGQVQRLQGQKKLVDTQVERYTKLVAKGAASQQDLDVQIGQQAENLGALAAAESQVKYAELYLQYCTILAPIDGQLSRTALQIGNLITADQTLLTSLVSLDPVYAYFNVEESAYLHIQTLTSEGLYKDPMNVDVKMGLADDVERRFPYTGKLDFVNNQVSPQTGTIMLRGVFANPHRLFKPGLFARVRAPIGPPHPTLLVTEQAISADQGQKFLYVVDAENKVKYRRVKIGLMFDGLRAIEEGLKPGERVIVNGLQRVRPGVEVKAATVEMKSLRADAEHSPKQ